MQLVSISLINKNGKRTGIYLYSPIVLVGGLYYYCECIRSNSMLRTKDVDVNKLIIKREIPKEYYKANGIELKGVSAAE